MAELVGYVFGADRQVRCKSCYELDSREREVLDPLPIMSDDMFDRPEVCEYCGALLNVNISRTGEQILLEDFIASVADGQGTDRERELIEAMMHYRDKIVAMIEGDPKAIYQDLVYIGIKLYNRRVENGG